MPNKKVFVAWRNGFRPGTIDWVSEKPDREGADWGYSSDLGKALPLTETMAKRFMNHMEYVNARGASIREV